jgi:hypothetical protein
MCPEFKFKDKLKNKTNSSVASLLYVKKYKYTNMVPVFWKPQFLQMGCLKCFL